MRAITCAFVTAGLLFSGPVLAQGNAPPAIRSDATAKAPAPVPGKNSFTAGEAEARMEKAGFTVDGPPVKDTEGVWHAQGIGGDGKSKRLMLDYQGNVFTAANVARPVSGRTTLTSDQARGLMEKRGYNVTSTPIKDDQGIWYAEGRLTPDLPVQVMVDREGNVFESAEFFGHPNSAPDTPRSPPNPIRPAPAPKP